MIKLRYALMGIVIVVGLSVGTTGYLFFKNSQLTEVKHHQMQAHREHALHILNLVNLLNQYLYQPEEMMIATITEEVKFILLHKVITHNHDALYSMLLQWDGKRTFSQMQIQKLLLYLNQHLITLNKEAKELLSQNTERHQAMQKKVWLISCVLFASMTIYILFISFNILRLVQMVFDSLKKIKMHQFSEGMSFKSELFEEAYTCKNMLIDTSRTLKKNFADIQSGKKLIEDILNTVPVRIFWKDKEGRYQGANELFLKDAGLQNMDELLNKKDNELPWTGEEADKFMADDIRVMGLGEPELQFEESQRSASGMEKWVVTSKVPLKDSYGRVVGILGIYDDISEKKRIEQAVKKQEEIILAQSRHAAMGEMLSMVAHQWRQPLSVIGMYVNNLILGVELDDLDKDNVREIADKINIHLQQLSQTIEGFRSYFEPQKELVEIAPEQIMQEVLKMVDQSFQEHHIFLNVDDQSHGKIKTYAREMTQVLINLLINAQEALSENEGVTEKKINVHVIDDKDELVWLVCDNAGGIDDDIIEKIFEPYFSTKEEQNGKGLGLYMSKMIVEKHLHGTLAVKNNDHGACFTLTLPKDITVVNSLT